MDEKLLIIEDDIEKVEAIMYAIEEAYMDIEVKPEYRRKAGLCVSAFYVIWDLVHKLSDDVSALSKK